MNWFRRVPSLAEFRARVEQEIEVLLLFRPWQNAEELPPIKNETYFAWLERNHPVRRINGG
jgi:hypothetical protein